MNRYIEKLDSWELFPILDSIKDAIFIDDANGYTLWCNKACEEMYKVKLESIKGIHINTLEQKGIFSLSVARIVLEHQSETTIIHENKEGRKLLSTGTPIFGPGGNITKVITTARDITELSNLQSKLEDAESTLKDMKTAEKFADIGLIARSNTMFQVVQLARKLANVDSTVLLTGESGVGKSLIAKILHENGSRKEHPFVTVNCGAIPENLMESELFGYEKGSFTGARSEGKKGFFATAQKGTIFLDEISELPLPLQVKLLQVIQERYIIPVGGTEKIPVDVRIISATNKNLRQLVDQGKFRDDLYYRLNVVPINVPPLRERPEDILPLIKTNLDKYNKKYNQNKTIDPDAMAVLLKFDWPGNVRELMNIIERLVITGTKDVVTVENLPSFLLTHPTHPQQTYGHDLTLNSAMEKAEREILEDAAGKFHSTRAMAKALDVSQPTIVRKLNKYGIKLSG